MNIPVAHSTDAVIKFFDVIKNDTPRSVTNEYLLLKGFSSENHAELRGIFRGLRFLDDANTPTRKWHDYRDENQEKDAIIQTAVREGYDELFKAFPDAYKEDKQELARWFREHKNYKPITAIRAVRMFKRLCEFAGFLPGTALISQTEQAIPSSSIEGVEAENKLIRDILDAADKFLKQTLDLAVEREIVTKRQAEEVFAMHLADGERKMMLGRMA